MIFAMPRVRAEAFDASDPKAIAQLVLSLVLRWLGDRIYIIQHTVYVSLAAPASAVPDRLAGWAIAAGVALAATAVLWPPPPRPAA